MAKYTIHAYVTMLHTCEVEAESLDEAIATWERVDGDERGSFDAESEEWDAPHGFELDGQYHEIEQDDDIEWDEERTE